MKKTRTHNVEEEEKGDDSSTADDGSQKTDVCGLDFANPRRVYFAWLKQQAHKANECACTVQSSTSTVTNTVPNVASSAGHVLLSHNRLFHLSKSGCLFAVHVKCNGRWQASYTQRWWSCSEKSCGSPSQEVNCIIDRHLSVALVFSHPWHFQPCLHTCSLQTF